MRKRWRRRPLAAAALGLTMLGSGSIHEAAAASNVQIVLDGYALPSSVPPAIIQGTTMVPFRAIAEALGITVTWSAADQTVIAAGKNASGQAVEVRLKVGQAYATVDGNKTALSHAPIMSNGSVSIPLAFFSRQFGAQVAWDNISKKVSVVSPKREMRLLGFYAISSYDQKSYLPSFNEVAFGWSQINDNGELTLKDENGSKWRWPQSDGEVTPESIIQEVRAQGDDSYLAVLAKDGKGQLTKLLTDAASRDASISQLHQLAVDKGFTGIMLDFEGLGWKDDPKTAQAGLNAYVKQLVKEVAPEGIKVSLAVPPPNGEYKGYDYAALSQMADELVLMAYDYGTTSAENKQPQSNAKVDQAIRMILATGVSRAKLLLAVNLDAENETSLQDKLGLAKRYNLGGTAFWRLGVFTASEKTAMDLSVTKEGK